MPKSPLTKRVKRTVHAEPPPRRRDLAGPRSPLDKCMSRAERVGVFRSRSVGPLLEGEFRVGDQVNGRMFDRVVVHVPEDDLADPLFRQWLLVDLRMRLAEPGPMHAVEVHAYPVQSTDVWHPTNYEHTEAEIAVRRAISKMPGGACEPLNTAGSKVGFRNRRPAPVDLADVAAYLDAVAAQLDNLFDSEEKMRERLTSVESDLAAVARVFGGPK